MGVGKEREEWELVCASTTRGLARRLCLIKQLYSIFEKQIENNTKNRKVYTELCVETHLVIHGFIVIINSGSPSRSLLLALLLTLFLTSTLTLTLTSTLTFSLSFRTFWLVFPGSAGFCQQINSVELALLILKENELPDSEFPLCANCKRYSPLLAIRLLQSRWKNRGARLKTFGRPKLQHANSYARKNP